MSYNNLELTFCNFPFKGESLTFRFVILKRSKKTGDYVGLKYNAYSKSLINTITNLTRRAVMNDFDVVHKFMFGASCNMRTGQFNMFYGNNDQYKIIYSRV